MSQNKNGFNPLKWDCATQGCFNKKKRPKIERFADCLPGQIAFTDIDAIVEIKGNLLLLEWKDNTKLPTGQRILFERLTRFCPATVFVIDGDAEQMTVRSVYTVRHGALLPPEIANLEYLRHKIRVWAKWALDNPVL